jgi:hypothetical protein
MEERAMSEPTISVFHRDPEGYARWLEVHPEGWLINDGDLYGPALHHATCDHIHPRSTSPEKDLTKNYKHCAQDRVELVTWADDIGINWGTCHRRQCKENPEARARYARWLREQGWAVTRDAMGEE